MNKNKVKFKYGAGIPPSTISDGTLLFNYTEGKVFFDIEGKRYDMNTASRIDIQTEEVNEYRPLLSHKDNLLYSVDNVDGNPRYNPGTGDISASTFSAKGLITISSDEAKDLGLKITGEKRSIGWIVGSGQENYGIFDYLKQMWILFVDQDDVLRIQLPTRTRRIYPDASSTYDLGRSDLKWAKVYADTFVGNLDGNATTATTATKIGTATVGGSTQPVYINAGKPTVISSLPVSLLSNDVIDNNINASSLFSVVEQAASFLHSANRLQFARAAGITIEYSTDGGKTWVDYGLSDAVKVGFVSGVSVGALLAGKKLSTKATADDKLRITLHATNMAVYTAATSLLINFSTNGSSGTKVDVEKAMRGSETEFTTWATGITLSGWSGWNSIPLLPKIGIGFGGGAGQTSNLGALRFTFYSEGAGASYTSGAHFSVLNMYMLGNTYWNTPSEMAKTGHLYKYNANQDMILPMHIYPNTTNTAYNGSINYQWLATYSKAFYEDGTSLSNKYAAKSKHFTCNSDTNSNAILKIGGVVDTVDYIHMYVTDKSDQKTRPLVINNGYGNVGIGVTQPTNKLEVNGNVKAAKFMGSLQGNADTATSATTATNLASAPSLSLGANPDAIAITVGGKKSNELVIPYAVTAGKVAIQTDAVNDYLPILTHDGSTLHSSDIEEGRPMCNFATGDIKATSFTGTLNGPATDLSGHREPSAETINYRPSAGNKSIKDDNASMEGIRGNSVVWNQLCDFANGFFSFGNGSATKENGIYTISINQDSNNATIFQFASPIPFNEHIWLAIAQVKADATVNIKGMSTVGFVPNERCKISALYIPISQNNWYWGLSMKLENRPTKVELYSYALIDLTQMFGAGNEPTTVEEFYSRIPVGVDMYTYNEGEIIDFKPKELKTVGFNQWDEQWKNGYYDTTTGQYKYYSEYICSVNPIKVISNVTYTASFQNANVMDFTCFDKDSNYIGVVKCYTNNIVFPTNTSFVHFSINQAAYNNDICINLVHTGYRNGEYEPYKSHTHDLSWINKYFPNGMKSAGSVHDEIRFNKEKNVWEAVQRVGVVDLGEFEWRYYDAVNCFYCAIPNIVSTQVNLMSSIYVPGVIDKNSNLAGVDKVVMSVSGGLLRIRDTAFNTDATSFKTAMSGVLLNYELAEYKVTEITDIVDMNYNVYDFGTEELLATKSSAFNANIIYQFNAVDRIRDNERNLNIIKDTYVKSDGGNASGSWNIDISGTAAVAETAFTLYTGGGDEGTPVYFDTWGNLKVCTNVATLDDLEWGD